VCGIAGFELAGDSDRDEIGRRLLGELANRGPDGGWLLARGPYGFAQTRLAVIDLSPNVTYPMMNEAGDTWLLFNGEVYDHAKLRAELERAGHRFRTRCDAEVMLHGYEEWGLGGLARIDGMFALALWDERREELILTRDPLGIKPLVHTTRGRFAFCSDALALVSSGLCAGQPDPEAIEGFAAFHYVPMPATGISGIAQVEPGVAVIRERSGRMRTQRWSRRPFTQAPAARRTVPREQIADLVAQALDDSVRRQLVADVPLGVFLSSGIDSSLVLDSAVRAGARPTAFTVGFAGHGDFDEAGPARRLAARLGVPHVCRDLSLTFHDALASVRAAYDQPFADASALATLAVARMAREHVTVALSGTGGDDLFAGYYRHRAHLLLPLTGRLSWLLRRLGAEPSADERRSAVRLARSYLARLAAAGNGDAFSQYLALASPPGGGELSRLLGLARPRGRERLAGRLGPQAAGASSILATIQAFELQTYLPSDLLTKEDRATMAVGLEGRVPLLGQDVVRLAESLEDRHLLTLRAGKLPLRAIAAQRLPRFITARRKRGFAVPLGALFAGSWREPAIEWLRDTSSSLLAGREVAEAIEAGGLHTTNVWAACVLMAWESRLAAARSRGVGLVAS
jgi:asparagine synthase (glutamine-hydrolysing)